MRVTLYPQCCIPVGFVGRYSSTAQSVSPRWTVVAGRTVCSCLNV